VHSPTRAVFPACAFTRPPMRKQVSDRKRGGCWLLRHALPVAALNMGWLNIMPDPQEEQTQGQARADRSGRVLGRREPGWPQQSESARSTADP